MRASFPTIIQNLKSYFLALLLVLLSATAYCQQSSLTINATSLENQPATGYFILTDKTIQDSTWAVRLSEGSAYFPFYVLGIDDNHLSENISIYPNPIGSGSDARIVISDDYQLAAIRVFNYSGKLLYAGEAPISEFRVNTGTGLLLIQFQDKEGSLSTKELVSNADKLKFSISSEATGYKKSAIITSYTLTFEDLMPEDPEFSDHSEQISIDDTEHKVMDITLPYEPKNINISGTTSPDATGVVKTGSEILGSLSIDGSGVIVQQTFHYAFSKEKILPVTVELTDEYADDISILTDAKHNQPIEIDTFLTYHYILSGTACSPIGALVEIYNEGVLIGSNVVNDASEYQIEWTVKTGSMTIDSIRVSKAGYTSQLHEDVESGAGNSSMAFNLDEISGETDYVRVWGIVSSSSGASVEDVEVKFVRNDNPTEQYLATTFNDGFSIYYDFGTTIPVYSEPEEYSVELGVEDGRGFITTTHTTSIPVQSPWVQRDFVIDSLPWQKIHGVIRDGDEIDTRLEGVTVKFMRKSDDSELDATISDANGYYKSNFAFTPNTEIYLLIGGKEGYYSRGGNQGLQDWNYEVQQPMYAPDTLLTFNWTLPRVVGKYGESVDDTITVSTRDIASSHNIENAMGRGALFNFEEFLNEHSYRTSEDINRFISEFKDAFPAADIRRIFNDYVLSNQEIIEYDYKTNYYPDSVITHCTNGPNITSWQYTIIKGDYQLLFCDVSLAGNQSGFNKEIGRALGLGETGYHGFMYDIGGPITNRDKRVANLILKQGQYQLLYNYDSWSYRNLVENIED